MFFGGRDFHQYIKEIGILIVIVVTVFSSKSGADERNTSAVAGNNFRLHPGNISQTEVFISVHPGEPNIMFASANTINFSPFFVSEGIYATTDGGVNWFGNDTCTGAPITFHGGDPGIAIDKDGTFILTRLGAGPFTGLYSHFSTDHGLTWSSQNTITTDILERASVATDGFPASNFYGRTYAVWVRLLTPYPTFFAYTDNGGASWSSPVQINTPVQRSAGGDVAVGSDGTVHVCWAGVQSTSPFTEVFVGYAKSTNGGNSWTVTENAFSTQGIKGMLPEKQNSRVDGLPRIAIDNSGGPRDGWIYIVTTQRNLAPAGNDPDIILHKSSDGGASWSAGMRVNQDELNNGKIQYMPGITVDAFGGINIIYYDDRTTTSDSSSVFLSRSIDGGVTWQDYEISDHHFKPVPIGGLGQGYQGDNIDIAAVGNTLWPVWMDNSTGIYQIWTSPIDLVALGTETPDDAPLPTDFELYQNYPNPFNPVTNIEFRIADFELVKLVIYDLLGREVKTLVHRKLAPGSYSVKWDGRDETGKPVASGVYIYRLRAGRNSLAKKALLLK